jgi:hypothetical protein
VVENPNLNPSMRSLLWLYSLVFAPGSVLSDERLRCEAVDEQTVKFHIRVDPETDPQLFSLRFDPRNGRLVLIETVRAASRDGRLLQFFFVLEGDTHVADGVDLPLRIAAAWDDGAYGRYILNGMRYNPALDEAFEQGINE